MKSKLWLALALLGLALAPVSAQQVSTPALNAIAGAYNTTTQNITAGKFGLIQIDSHGNMVVSCTNCGAASITGPFNVTVTNTAATPVIVSTANGFGGSGGSSNVTITNSVITEVNSAAILAAIQGAIPAGSAQIGIVTIQNTNSASPAFVQTVPGTTVGWTPILLNALTTTKTTIKNAAGKLAKLYCYNPNSSVAYVQVFDALTGSVTLGTTSPKNSYGIAATSIGGFGSAIGDTYSTAISIAATTTVAGLTAPSTPLDCNVSYN